MLHRAHKSLSQIGISREAILGPNYDLLAKYRSFNKRVLNSRQFQPGHRDLHSARESQEQGTSNAQAEPLNSGHNFSSRNTLVKMRSVPVIDSIKI